MCEKDGRSEAHRQGKRHVAEGIGKTCREGASRVCRPNMAPTELLRARAQRRPSRAAATPARKAGLLKGLPHCGAPGRAEDPAGGPPHPAMSPRPLLTQGWPSKPRPGREAPQSTWAPHLWCGVEVDGNKPPPASSILRCPESLPARQRLELTQEPATPVLRRCGPRDTKEARRRERNCVKRPT